MAAAEESPADDRVQKFLDDLESQHALLSNCTLLWKSLVEHFSSLRQALALRSQSLDAHLQDLESNTQKSLDSLALRDSSLPDRESAAAAALHERRDAALAEIQRSDVPSADLRGLLRWYARRMDSPGLWRFVVSRRKDLHALRREVPDAVAASLDPARLVVDASEDFLNHHSDDGGADRNWALGMLLRSLLISEGGKAPEVAESMREKAAAVAEAWKEKFSTKEEGGEGGGGTMGGSEAQIFLQMVVAFGLRSRFEEGFLKKLVLEHASRKDMAKLAASLGLGEQLADVIDELVKTGKEIEAVYFVHESGLTERFPPDSLLKLYLQASRKKANSISKNGNNSIAAKEESSNMEINALKSIIKCVETCKLGSKFNVDGLKKRLAEMEKIKADRKRSAVANKPQGKRLRSAAGATPILRPAKAARGPNKPYTPYGQNPAAVSQIPAARHVYSYPGHGGFDGLASAQYGAPRSQSPATVPHQYYAHDDMGALRAGMYHGGPSITYGGYDYTAPAPTQQSRPH
ncbi:hypothetical protein OPV22_023324 [Ensete ventricosum]|uniref:FRIGIDA-like protein n=1 Tax=Ensete ventricosum TaxID=4639 RepID=A0AAV8QSN2_ENSVE|nr:hypothetical protein OPV22_023324 [Ensete ventricosum]